jgi:hypothetical protein
MLKILEKICHSEKGFAVYQDGMNDQAAADYISELMGQKITASHVSHVRREIFGEVMTIQMREKLKEQQNLADVLKKIQDMSDWCRLLEQKVLTHERQITHMEQMLKNNVQLKYRAMS